MIFHNLKPGSLKRPGFRKYYNLSNQKRSYPEKDVWIHFYCPVQNEIKMFRNRLFSRIVAAMVVIAIVLSLQRAFAAKAIVQETNYAHTEWALRAASSLVEEDLASLSYISRLNQCFDIPFSELASCRDVLGERDSQTL
jgi:hypothetical protein